LRPREVVLQQFIGRRVEAYDAPYAWLMAEYRITGAAFANL
jgi:hypothetical protein